MLALTDAALARLCIAATRIDPRRRGRWLREIAAKLDPPSIPADLRGGDREPAKRMVRSEAVRRRARAADTARWRERLHRGAAVYPVEVDGMTFDLMERFAGLKDRKTGDRQVVATALGKLLLSPPLWASCCAARWRRCCGKKLLPGAS
jgi:hypothetical protein